jgi:hypothetical protein
LFGNSLWSSPALALAVGVGVAEVAVAAAVGVGSTVAAGAWLLAAAVGDAPA